MPERASKTLTPISGTEGVLAQRLLLVDGFGLGNRRPGVHLLGHAAAGFLRANGARTSSWD
jgi:hypothetical protein